MLGHSQRWLAACAALLWSCLGASAGEAPVRAFDWIIDAPWFGGFSGLELGADGREALIIGDRGVVLTARIQRTRGRITDIDVDPPVLLRDHAGRELQGYWADPEGLAIRADGSFCLTHEGIARVACHADPAAAGRVLPRPHAFLALPANRSLEALAIDGDGRLIAIAEWIRPTNRIPLYIWSGTDWSIGAAVPASDGYAPVGADIGPDGRLYILERAIRMVGFQSRLRRWRYDDGHVSGPGAVVWESQSGAHDNLEGLALWQAHSGQIWATMISDDNFRFFQRTEIVEIPIPD